MISEAWTNRNIPDPSISVYIYFAYQNDRLKGRGRGCFIYGHSSLNSLLCHIPDLNKLQDSMWIVLKPLNPIILPFDCVNRQLNASVNEAAVLSEVFTLASSPPFTGKLIYCDLNIPYISWSQVKAPKRYALFIKFLELGHWIQYVSSPTIHQNILDLDLIRSLIAVTVHNRKTFPGSSHNIVMCSLNIKTTTGRHETVTIYKNYLKVDKKTSEIT